MGMDEEAIRTSLKVPKGFKAQFNAIVGAMTASMCAVLREARQDQIEKLHNRAQHPDSIGRAIGMVSTSTVHPDNDAQIFCQTLTKIKDNLAIGASAEIGPLAQQMLEDMNHKDLRIIFDDLLPYVTKQECMIYTCG